MDDWLSRLCTVAFKSRQHVSVLCVSAQAANAMTYSALLSLLRYHDHYELRFAVTDEDSGVTQWVQTDSSDFLECHTCGRVYTVDEVSDTFCGGYKIVCYGGTTYYIMLFACSMQCTPFSVERVRQMDARIAAELSSGTAGGTRQDMEWS